jgi:hypothetical protein
MRDSGKNLSESSGATPSVSTVIFLDEYDEQGENADDNNNTN